MLQAEFPSNYSLRTSPSKSEKGRTSATDSHLNMSDDDSSNGGKGGGRNKSRRELPAGAVATLKAWLLSPEHFTHPYPTPQDQVMLMQKTGIDKKQLKNWFTNARRRIWKPMLKKQLEQGKLTTTTVGGVVVPGVMANMPAGADNSGMGGVTYQQEPAQTVDMNQYGNTMYVPQQVAGPTSYNDPYASNSGAGNPMPMSSSIGSLPPMSHTGSAAQLNKTDSHAVLMELFARDQDLVRQATEGSAGKKGGPSSGAQGAPQQQQQQPQGSSSTQVPMKYPSSGRLMNVPTLNSWPHFSSVSSLNNLGTMPGVKSITSLSGVDLANQGYINRTANLAQVKSVESMGKNDSYAFLEVFFGERSSNNLSAGSSSNKDPRGVKRERDDDNDDVGLSLEDEGPSAGGSNIKQENSSNNGGSQSGFMNSSGDQEDNSGHLKRAYDDALAARGLLAVSRSCEKLNELPAKMQRSLSQEYIRHQQDSHYDYNKNTPDLMGQPEEKQSSSQQYPGQHPVQHKHDDPNASTLTADPNNDVNSSVEVSSASKCAICHQNNVDTQLRPCGHMFHERCLKPSLQTPMGPPKCPVDQICIQSALLAVPTDEIVNAVAATESV